MKVAPLLFLPFAAQFVLACHHTPPELLAFPASCVRTRDCTEPVTIPDDTLPRGTILGLVVDRFDMRLVGYAQVKIVSTGIITIATEKGAFRLSGLHPGPDTLDIRFIGYQRSWVPVILPQATGVRILVPLQPLGLQISY